MSDFHDLVFFSTKQQVPKRGKRCVKYRSYKKFDVNKYKTDLEQIPFHVSEIFDNYMYDDMYSFSEQLKCDE